ncbi:MAG TPA: protease modulator HflC [Gammaproteobacteria bacterium]|nr:protease modulator HflC [Gammaproteobacteria bacterium]
MGAYKTASLIILLLAGMLLSMSLFTVNEREYAILFRLGEITRSDYKPGLHMKMPLINNVRKFDRRVLVLDARPELFLTSEKKNVNVDYFVEWRINDVRRYYTAVGGQESQALQRLSRIINDGMLAEFAKRTIQEVVSGERAKIMELVQEMANKQAQVFGVEVVDVRIKRIDLPPEVSNSVYQRMRAERTRVAKELRSRGAEAAERIRAEADRQRTVILAEAYRESEQIRGEGDAKATEIYAKAYQKDPEFYSLYHSLDAYKKVFRDKDDLLVIQPDSEFFKYFKDSKAGKP